MATSTVIQHVITSDGTEDTRYSVTFECTGHDDKWYAVRFEGHWVGESTDEDDAWHLARHHNAKTGQG